MKIISKIVVWILSLIAIFIVANLVIGCFQYKGIGNYIQILENKDWSSTIAQVNINNPISIFSIFYEEGYIDIPDDASLTQTGDILSENDTVDIQNTTGDVVEENNIDPYDPEFEDDFNDFFDGESNEIEDIENNTGDTAKDDTVEQNDVDTGHTIAEELIQKFNE